jgi:AcrR family transcriptional regulator
MAVISDIAQRRALARKNPDLEYGTRRAALREAAARVFRRKGFSAAKLQDIAAEVGMDRATIYYYVSGKDELFQDVVAGASLESVLMVEALRSADGTANEKLAILIEELLGAYERHYPYLYVYVQENMSQMTGESAWSREMLGLTKRFDGAVRDIVHQGLQEGSIISSTRDDRLIANAIIGMCNWSYRWFHPKGEGDAKRVADIFIGLVLNGLNPR